MEYTSVCERMTADNGMPLIQVSGRLIAYYYGALVVELVVMLVLHGVPEMLLQKDNVRPLVVQETIHYLTKFDVLS
ncbi:hypothetical protein TNCV_1065081 [Trichonephila clavipes]|nr:hypothetical protein TNCV_1065081 [Trichonephila clavipes]